MHIFWLMVMIVGANLWAAVLLQAEQTVLTETFDNPNIWYVTDTFGGAQISTDNGLTWLPSNEGIRKQLGPTSDWIPIFSLTVDPHNPQIVWAGTDKTGHIYKSTDGGQTWAQINDGLTTRSTTGLAISSDSQHVYVTTNGGGIFRLDLKGIAPVMATGG